MRAVEAAAARARRGRECVHGNWAAAAGGGGGGVRPLDAALRAATEAAKAVAAPAVAVEALGRPDGRPAEGVEHGQEAAAADAAGAGPGLATPTKAMPARPAVPAPAPAGHTSAAPAPAPAGVGDSDEPDHGRGHEAPAGMGLGLGLARGGQAGRRAGLDGRRTAPTRTSTGGPEDPICVE